MNFDLPQELLHGERRALFKVKRYWSTFAEIHFKQSEKPREIENWWIKQWKCCGANSGAGTHTAWTRVLMNREPD